MVATRRGQTAQVATAAPAPATTRKSKTAGARQNARAKQQALNEQVPEQLGKILDNAPVSPKKTRSGRHRSLAKEQTVLEHETAEAHNEPQMMDEPVKKTRTRRGKQVDVETIAEDESEQAEQAAEAVECRKSSPAKVRVTRRRAALKEEGPIVAVAKKPAKRNARGRQALSAKQEENASTPVQAASNSPAKPLALPSPKRLSSPLRRDVIMSPRLAVFTEPEPSAVHAITPKDKSASVTPPVSQGEEIQTDAETSMFAQPARLLSPELLKAQPSSMARGLIQGMKLGSLPSAALTPAKNVTSFAQDTPVQTQVQSAQQSTSVNATLATPAEPGHAAEEVFAILDEMALAPESTASPFKMPALPFDLHSLQPKANNSAAKLRMSAAKYLASPLKNVGHPVRSRLSPSKMQMSPMQWSASPASSMAATSPMPTPDSGAFMHTAIDRVLPRPVRMRASPVKSLMAETPSRALPLPLRTNATPFQDLEATPAPSSARMLPTLQQTPQTPAIPSADEAVAATPALHCAASPVVQVQPTPETGKIPSSVNKAFTLPDERLASPATSALNASPVKPATPVTLRASPAVVTESPVEEAAALGATTELVLDTAISSQAFEDDPVETSAIQEAVVVTPVIEVASPVRRQPSPRKTIVSPEKTAKSPAKARTSPRKSQASSTTTTTDSSPNEVMIVAASPAKLAVASPQKTRTSPRKQRLSPLKTLGVPILARRSPAKSPGRGGVARVDAIDEADAEIDALVQELIRAATVKAVLPAMELVLKKQPCAVLEANPENDQVSSRSDSPKEDAIFPVAAEAAGMKPLAAAEVFDKLVDDPVSPGVEAEVEEPESPLAVEEIEEIVPLDDALLEATHEPMAEPALIDHVEEVAVLEAAQSPAIEVASSETQTFVRVSIPPIRDAMTDADSMTHLAESGLPTTAAGQQNEHGDEDTPTRIDRVLPIADAAQEPSVAAESHGEVEEEPVVLQLSSDPLEAAVEELIEDLTTKSGSAEPEAAITSMDDQVESLAVRSSPAKAAASSPAKALKPLPVKAVQSSPRKAASPAKVLEPSPVKQVAEADSALDTSRLSIGSAMELSFISAKNTSINLDFSPVRLPHVVFGYQPGEILSMDVPSLDSHVAITSPARPAQSPVKLTENPIKPQKSPAKAKSSVKAQKSPAKGRVRSPAKSLVTTEAQSTQSESPYSLKRQLDENDVDEAPSSPPAKKQKRSARRQSRRQSYMTATKTAVREREIELANRQAQQDAADVQLAMEAEAESEVGLAASLLVEMPGSVERKRTRRRSSLAAKSPLSKVQPPAVASDETLDLSSAESFSPIVQRTQTQSLQEASAIKIQAVFRGWRERKYLSEAQEQSHSAEHTSDEIPDAGEVTAEDLGDVTVEDVPSDVVASLEAQADAQVEAQDIQTDSTAKSKSKKGGDLNVMFDDFLKSWQTKKSQKATEPAPGPPSPVKPEQSTPRRTIAGVLSPQKSAQKAAAVVVLPPSAQKVKSRALRSQLPAPKNQLPVVAAAAVPVADRSKSRIVQPKRGIPVPIRASAAIVSPTKPLELERKRKDAPEADMVAPRAKRARAVSTSALAGPMRSKTPPVMLGARSAPTTPKKLLHLTPAEVTKATRNFTSQNRLYRCDFERVVVHKDMLRPASPPPKQQAKLAQALRVKRRNWTKEKGYTFGAGDDESYQPTHVTPTRKAIKWSETLEVDLLTLPKTSPSRAALLAGDVNSCIAQLSLDDFGNAEGTVPLTPVIGPAPKVVVKKLLYRGEVDD